MRRPAAPAVGPDPGPPAPAGGRSRPADTSPLGRLRDPRTAVLGFLLGALVLGGGRKVLQAIRARRAVAALGGTNPAVADVEAAADHGRAALPDLFRLLGEAARPEVRAAAGRALARLWRADELIAEEERGIVRAGFAVDWRARRTYPRGLKAPITVGVGFGVPFLVDDGRGVGPADLAWSYRIRGTERAQLDEWAVAPPGAGAATFQLYPDDFPTNGPHRLALQARVRTVGLTDAWELDLPQVPASFEFDPRLAVDALLAQPDDARAARVAAAVRLEPAAGDLAPPPLDLTADLLLRDPPRLAIVPPLPCDLAHRVAVEFEGIPGTRDAGTLVVAAADLPGAGPALFPLGPIAPRPDDSLDRPGPRRLRAILTADPGLGWADPAIRSIWPAPIVTDWLDVRLIRR